MEDKALSLSEAEKTGMESFVERKMEETKVCKLVEWDPVDARRCLGKVLFD